MYFNAKKILSLFLPGIFFFLYACEINNTGDLPGDPVNITTEAYQKEVIDSANRFAFDLFRPVINDAKGEENIMISPFSITSALSMALNGAAGETYEAMIKTLRIEDKTLQQINETYLKLMTEMVPVDVRVIVEIANSVWVEKHISAKKPFMDALETWYKAEARDIDINDPHALDIVNDWIADKTHDKITDMLDHLESDLAMLLINAVYFNGKWRYQFDKEKTGNEPFYVTQSTPKDVPMMHQKTELNMAVTENSTIVELPYGRGNYTMMVVLPEENVTTKEISDALTPDLWNEWISLLENNTREVILSMPRFKYEYKRNLNNDLINMGMGIAFSPSADFSNICDNPLMISRVEHQTFIETNEEGTEAAAATVIVFKDSAVGPTIEINLNRPFLYFIREISTGTILFMGRVSDPDLN